MSTAVIDRALVNEGYSDIGNLNDDEVNTYNNANDVYLDGTQSTIASKFSTGTFLSKQENVNHLIEWITFYRRNIHRFAIHFLGLHLHLYQIFVLALMSISPKFILVAARAASKSYIIAIYACCRCILYDNEEIVIASATQTQSELIITKKILVELCGQSPMLRQQIKEKYRNKGGSLVLSFKTGSTITIVGANENARGNRATILIVDEYRMVKKNIYDTVLIPFLHVRESQYTKDSRYRKANGEPVVILLSSAWFQNHWMGKSVDDGVEDMISEVERTDDFSTTVIGLDYTVTLVHNIKPYSTLKKAFDDSDSVAWRTEYENEMIRENTNAWFDYKMLEKNQKIKKAFYPRDNVDFAANKRKTNPYVPKKLDGEIRVLACDISFIAGDNNDNSVYTLLRAMPEKVLSVSNRGKSYKTGFHRYEAFIESLNGGNVIAQATRIKQLFYDFDCDYCVLDTRNGGFSIFNLLSTVMYDEVRDVEYEPWTVINNEKYAKSAISNNAKPVIFSINATSELNNEIAVTMRSTLEDGKIDLLVGLNDVRETVLKNIPEYESTTNLDTQLFYEKPYIETQSLINEMTALEYEKNPQTGSIRIYETGSRRKDRYSSISYGNFFISLMEKELLTDVDEYEFVPLCN